MKILTAVIVMIVIGGGTAATVATVGNVDWDAGIRKATIMTYEG